MVGLALVREGEAARPQPGTVHGTVTLRRGPARAEQDDASGVVVYVPDFKRAAVKKTLRLTERDHAFKSEIIPVVAGTTIEFVNRDPIYHDLFSLSAARPFDLGLVEPGNSAYVRFDVPGLVAVFCNIHPQLAAYVLVLSNPAFTLTNDDGDFTLTGLPAGRHKLVAWTPRARPLVTIVDVPEGGDVTLDLIVDETLTVGPHANKFGLAYAPGADGGN